MQEEIWKDIPETDGLYMASNIGNILSVKRNKILNQNISNRGYFRVTINGKQTSTHRIICAVFLDKEEGRNYVNHKNKIKTDNRVENLEWVSPRENTFHHLHDGKIKINFSKKYNRFEPWICINGKNRRIGRFKNEHDAVEAYLSILKKHNINIKYLKL